MLNNKLILILTKLSTKVMKNTEDFAPMEALATNWTFCLIISAIVLHHLLGHNVDYRD